MYKFFLYKIVGKVLNISRQSCIFFNYVIFFYFPNKCLKRKIVLLVISPLTLLLVGRRPALPGPVCLEGDGPARGHLAAVVAAVLGPARRVRGKGQTEGRKIGRKEEMQYSR